MNMFELISTNTVKISIYKQKTKHSITNKLYKMKINFLLYVTLTGMISCLSPSETTNQSNSALRMDKMPPIEEQSIQAAENQTKEISGLKLLGQAFGRYEGKLPCSDCEGTVTLLEIDEGMSFVMDRKYIGKETRNPTLVSKYTFDENTNIITLNDMAGEPNKFLVKLGSLTLLDENSKIYTGNLADKYVLTKISE
jgi:hypothetical protein